MTVTRRSHANAAPLQRQAPTVGLSARASGLCRAASVAACGVAMARMAAAAAAPAELLGSPRGAGAMAAVWSCSVLLTCRPPASPGLSRDPGRASSHLGTAVAVVVLAWLPALVLQLDADTPSDSPAVLGRRLGMCGVVLAMDLCAIGVMIGHTWRAGPQGQAQRAALAARESSRSEASGTNGSRTRTAPARAARAPADASAQPSACAGSNTGSSESTRAFITAGAVHAATVAAQDDDTADSGRRAAGAAQPAQPHIGVRGAQHPLRRSAARVPAAGAAKGGPPRSLSACLADLVQELAANGDHLAADRRHAPPGEAQLAALLSETVAALPEQGTASSRALPTCCQVSRRARTAARDLADRRAAQRRGRRPADDARTQALLKWLAAGAPRASAQARELLPPRAATPGSPTVPPGVGSGV